MGKVCIHLIFATILFFGIQELNAQNQPLFKHLTIDKGLSNGSVTDIVQDSIGFIWLATKNGLNRFDGSTCKVYHQGNSNISSNDITALFIDSRNRFWIGTNGGGINIYNVQTNRFSVYKNEPEDQSSISSNIVHGIFEDEQGNIWLGTENGLNKFVAETQSFLSFRDADNKRINSIWSIAESKNGELWIGTYGAGLKVFNKETGQFLPCCKSKVSPIDLTTSYINSILPISNSRILIGTNGNGLIDFNPLSAKVSSFFINTKFEDVSIVRTMWKSSNGILWIGTDGQGIIKVDVSEKSKVKFENYLNDKRFGASLSNNTINTFYQDTQSNIWIGTAWRGANILKNELNEIKFFYSDTRGYDSSPILSVYKENADLWIGTDGEGLSIMNLKSNRLNLYDKNSHSPFVGDFVQCIKPGVNNNYWLGTFASGLISFNKISGETTQFKRNTNDKTSLPFNDVRDVLELKSGNLWVATWGGGLSYYQKQARKFTSYQFAPNDPKSISSNNVLAMLPQTDGKLWLATYGGGLNCFDPATQIFTHFMVDDSNLHSIGNNYVFSLLKDQKGNLWIGTKEGLNRLNVKTKEFEKFKIGTSTYSNTIVGLLDDDDGFIWMSTKEGIFRLNTETKNIEAVPNVDDAFHINAVFKDQYGIFYFGSTERVVSFNPKKFRSYAYHPPVKLTNFKLFNKDVIIGDNQPLKKQIFFENDITLKYKQRVMTFDFTALNYPFSGNKPFEVKMEGFEENWRDIGLQKSATYTNLSPGDYIFKVRKQVANEIQKNENTASISIKILPPLWLTWWAYLIYAFLLAMVLWIYRRYTLKWAEIKNELKFEKLQREQEDELHELKQRFFTNISHEIRTPLTLIAGPVNQLLRFGTFNATEQKQFSLIRHNTNRLMTLVNELLNFRKLETGNIKLKVKRGNIVDFVNEIYLSYSQQAISKEINYLFEKQADHIGVWFDQKQLEKAVYNLLSNAFKYTDKNGMVKVVIKQEGNFVVIQVTDSGIGISKERLPYIFDRFYQTQENSISNKGFGIGLSICKEIVELHSGSILVSSQLGKGSEFIIKIPLGKNHFKNVEFIHQLQDEESIEHYHFISELTEAEKDLQPDLFKGASILIVEDNEHIRNYLDELLSNIYVVFQASNGCEGLEKAIDLVPDAVVSDVMMPVMDGISFCHEIKTDVRTSHIPVILLTARTLIANKIEGYETGADDYVTKPFNESVLKARIKNLLNNRKMLRDRFLKESIINPKEISLNSPDEEFLTKLVSIVEQNIDIPGFSIDQLSKDIAMSHSNVYKKLKALTGMTVVAFVRDFRLKRAAQLLTQQKISIIDVCFKVGYTDRRHFSQEFKKKFGISPSIYAKENFSS